MKVLIIEPENNGHYFILYINKIVSELIKAVKLKYLYQKKYKFHLMQISKRKNN